MKRFALGILFFVATFCACGYAGFLVYRPSDATNKAEACREKSNKFESEYVAQARLVNMKKAEVQSLAAIKEKQLAWARDKECGDAYSQSLSDQRDFLTTSSYLTLLASLLSSTVGVHLFLKSLSKKQHL